MASSDLVAIPQQADYATFDTLRLGRSSQQVVGRLLRFWDARNIKKDGEFMGIVLLFLDEKSALIHGFIPEPRATQYRDVLREGLIFQIGVFEVGRCKNLYRITDHPYVIRFLPDTTIVPLSSVDVSIGREKFMLRNLHPGSRRIRRKEGYLARAMLVIGKKDFKSLRQESDGDEETVSFTTTKSGQERASARLQGLVLRNWHQGSRVGSFKL